MRLIKIPFGLCDGLMLAPSHVKQGLDCNCVCPECKTPLVAKRPKQKVWHFAHYGAQGSAKCYETAIHSAAKQVLFDKKQIYLPAIEASSPYLYDEFSDIGIESVTKSTKAKLITFDLVEKESRDFNEVCPDIVAYNGNKCLFIEIAVTHFTDKEKLEKLKNLGISTLEINLSREKQIFTLELIEKLVINSPHNRLWIFNPKIDNLKKKATDQAKNELVKKCEELFGSSLFLKQRSEDYRKLTNEQKIQLELSVISIDSKEMNTDDKLKYLKNMKIIGLDVRFGNCFGVSKELWQIFVYRRFLHAKHLDNITVNDVSDLLLSRFSKTISIESADKIAVWDYFKKLEENGFLEKQEFGHQEFMVIKDANGSF